MTMITIDELRRGTLIPLQDVVARLPINQTRRIRLRDFQNQLGHPLEMTLQGLESRTKSKQVFESFAASDMQIIDGQIELEIQCGERT